MEEKTIKLLHDYIVNHLDEEMEWGMLDTIKNADEVRVSYYEDLGGHILVDITCDGGENVGGEKYTITISTLNLLAAVYSK